jgi:O-acetylhomoserine (thiol)-lyase
VGLEDIDDILWDLDHALTEAQNAAADDAVVLEEPADTCTIGAQA